jgi:hypothetical protein
VNPRAGELSTNEASSSSRRQIRYGAGEHAGRTYTGWWYSCRRCGHEAAPMRWLAGAERAELEHQSRCGSLGKPDELELRRKRARG